MYKLVFFVPVNEAQKVKDAIFAIGAGTLGNYAHCSWETLGTGQFLPLNGSNPTIGVHGILEQIDELRVEILCTEQNVRQAIIAMKAAHSYEEPAYEIYQVLTLDSLP